MQHDQWNRIQLFREESNKVYSIGFAVIVCNGRSVVRERINVLLSLTPGKLSQDKPADR